MDVIGRDGSYIAVGGPAKAKDLAKLGSKLHILKYAAEQEAGFIHQYEVGWTKTAVPAVLASCEALGMHIRNPADGHIVAVSNDWESMGEPVVIDEHFLVEWLALKDRDEQSFNYWIDADVNVYCRVRRVTAEVAVQEYGLDGLTFAQRDFVVRAIISVFLQRLTTAAGLVIDRTGAAEDTDWDQVVLAGSEEMPEVPDLLVVTENSASRWAGTAGLGSFVTRQVGDLVAYDRAGLLDL